MKLKILFILFFVFSKSISQDSLKVKPTTFPNPILFGEFYLGIAGGSSSGFFAGGNLNYQIKDNLLTARIIGFSNIKYAGSVIIIPIYTEVEAIEEYAFLYGKRNIYGNHSFSYSAGISLVKRKYLDSYRKDLTTYTYQNSLGFPFEINVKWFKRDKKPYRLYYGLIPIGNRKVSFGRSFGFKLVGNISKTYFVGIGLNFGLGWHKKYN